MEDNNLLTVLGFILALVAIAGLIGLLWYSPTIARNSVNVDGIDVNRFNINSLDNDFAIQQITLNNIKQRVFVLEKELGETEDETEEINELIEEVEDLTDDIDDVDDVVTVIRRCLLGAYSGFNESEYVECLEEKI